MNTFILENKRSPPAMKPKYISTKKYEFKAAWGTSPHPDKAWKGG